MPTSTAPAEKDWSLFINRHFQDFEEFAELNHGWDLDFRQLQAGRSPVDLLQFGTPDFVVAHFSMSLAYDQRGGTPPNMSTFAILDDGVRGTITPEGPLTDDGLWCFPANHEFEAVSKAEFRGYALSLSDALLDEVEELCELSDARTVIGSGHVVRCRRRADINGIRQHLGRISHAVRSEMVGLYHQGICSNGSGRDLAFPWAFALLVSLFLISAPNPTGQPSLSLSW